MLHHLAVPADVEALVDRIGEAETEDEARELATEEFDDFDNDPIVESITDLGPVEE